MPAELKPHIRMPECEEPRTRRADWRQRLVDAERGLTLGFRADSSFFAHLFMASLIVAAGIVLRLNVYSWSVLVISLTVVVAAELFNQGLRAAILSKGTADSLPPHLQTALRMGTAGVMTSLAGALLVAGVLLGDRVLQLCGR